MLLAAALATPAVAAPLRVRPAPAAEAGATATDSWHAAAPEDATRFCGTRVDGVGEALAEALLRPPVETLPTTFSRDVGEIAVLEDDGSFYYTNAGGRRYLDIASTMRAFYRTHGDDYDQVAIYLPSGVGQWLGSPGALAAAWPVLNDTQGIGLSLYDFTSLYGSAGRLTQVLTMNGLHRYPADLDAGIGGPGDSFSTMDVLAHEFGHRWLSYVFVDSAGTTSPALLGRDLQHWGFFADVDSSFMEGCDWTEVAPDSFRTTGVSSTFGALDRYLMGAITRSEIDSFFVVNEPVAFDPPGIYIPITTPFVGLGCRGRETWWRVDDVERVHGPRMPDGAVAPRAFRVAFVLATLHGTDATPADLAKLEQIRQRFPAFMADATGQRFTVDCTLESRVGRVAIAHEPLGHTEDALSPRPLAARVRMEGGGLAAGIASATLWWRPGTSGAFAPVPMSPVAPDSFAAEIPASPPGVVQYFVHAASDSPGVEATLPAAGASAPLAYAIGPDIVPPVITHARIAEIGVDQLPHPLIARIGDNGRVDAAWLELSVNGGPVQTLPPVRVVRDSFTFTLPSGAPIGGTLAYRVVARDGALAANFAVTASGFDTIRVRRSTWEPFENGADWFHQNVLFSWRDSWRNAVDPTSPAGPSVWKCGEPGDAPYAPHLDAVLYSSWFYTLQPGAQLSFDHRWQLESYDATRAWDGARIEIQTGNVTAPWNPVTPAPGYTHTMLPSGMPFAQGSPCWSGTSPGWVHETLDLSPWVGLTVRFRFRMASDDFLGFDGWRVDGVRVLYPGDVLLDAPPAAGRALHASRAWPNPVRSDVAMTLTLATPGDVEWMLYDVQGRRAATLWSGPLPAGSRTLRGALPAGIAPGLYLSRVRAGTHTAPVSPLVVVR